MSLALCLACGNIKFGALCECDECGAGSTGNTDLDILFSDWQMSEVFMEELSNIITKINSISNNKEVNLWAFLAYMSKEHPDILEVNVPNEFRMDANNLLLNLYLNSTTQEGINMQMNFMSNKFGGMLIDINNVENLEVIDKQLFLFTKHQEKVYVCDYDLENEAYEDKRFYDAVLKNPAAAVVLIENKGLMKVYDKFSEEYKELSMGLSYEM